MVCAPTVLVLKPQSLALGSPRRPPGGGRPSRPCRFVWERECGLVGSVLAAAERCKVPGCLRTVPPSTILEHHPPATVEFDIDIVDAIKNQLRRFLDENASPWSRRLAEPLPQAIDQADDASLDSVACTLHIAHCIPRRDTCSRDRSPDRKDSLTRGGDRATTPVPSPVSQDDQLPLPLRRSLPTQQTPRHHRLPHGTDDSAPPVCLDSTLISPTRAERCAQAEPRGQGSGRSIDSDPYRPPRRRRELLDAISPTPRPPSFVCDRSVIPQAIPAARACRFRDDTTRHTSTNRPSTPPLRNADEGTGLGPSPALQPTHHVFSRRRLAPVRPHPPSTISRRWRGPGPVRATVELQHRRRLELLRPRRRHAASHPPVPGRERQARGGTVHHQPVVRSPPASPASGLSYAARSPAHCHRWLSVPVPAGKRADADGGHVQPAALCSLAVHVSPLPLPPVRQILGRGEPDVQLAPDKLHPSGVQPCGVCKYEQQPTAATGDRGRVQQLQLQLYLSLDPTGSLWTVPCLDLWRLPAGPVSNGSAAGLRTSVAQSSLCPVGPIRSVPAT